MSKNKRQLLALPPSEPNLHSPQVISTFSLVPDLAKKIEPVGKFYAQLQYRVKNNLEEIDHRKAREEDKNAQDEGQNEIDDAEADANAKDYEKKRKKRTKDDIEREALLMGDLYATLGLENLTFEASEAQIGKAYRKAALHFHPDKLGDAITEKDKEVWLKIQNAYDTLIDPVKRKKYDSSLPFDDKCPSKDDFTSDAKFYELLNRCFNNNARFSQIKPVPTIGDNSTPMDEVYKFYKFWDNFKTWREFSQYDEYDLDEAGDRYERRWMENQNKKCRAKYDKEERKRIFDLVELAYSNDPRIIR
jgi:DnaJ homolog subfamily C member 2